MLQQIKRFRFHAEHAAFFGMFTIFCVILMAAYWEFWPPLDYVFRLTGPITMNTKEVTSGVGVVSYSMPYCKNHDYDEVHSLVQHTFVDHVIQYSVATSGSLPTGCHSVTIEIPTPLLKPGPYHLQITREYDLSPIRHESRTFESDAFAVHSSPTVEVPQEVMTNLEHLVVVNRDLELRIRDLLTAQSQLIEANRQIRDKIPAVRPH